MIKVSPSLLSSKLTNLHAALECLKTSGADYAHVDCMDGHFVNNMAFGPSFVSALKKEGIIDLDVHLMIENPLRYIDSYINSSSILTVHLETIDENDFFDILKRIHNKNKLMGISLRPNTKIENLKKYLPYVDVVLVMSVMPGFSGQKFMDIAYEHIEYLVKYRKKNNFKYLIEVDGGVDETNYPKLIQMGVDILVSGNYLFANEEEMPSKIKKMKELGK